MSDHVPHNPVLPRGQGRKRRLQHRVVDRVNASVAVVDLLMMSINDPDCTEGRLQDAVKPEPHTGGRHLERPPCPRLRVTGKRMSPRRSGPKEPLSRRDSTG